MSLRSIADLKPAKKNARKRTPRGADMLENSLRQFGAARSIVTDERGEIIAGHGTVEAAKKAGITKVREVRTAGDELVVVVREGLSEKQKQEMAVADNRTSELAEWDESVLAGLRSEVDLTQFFNEKELGDIELDLETEQITEVKVQPPPDMVWVLVGVPLSDWSKVADHLTALEAVAGISVKATANATRKAEG